MDNPANVTPDLVGRGWSATADQTAEVAQTWLDVAWRALQCEPEVPSLVERITSGDLAVADVIDVVAAAALRVLRNPEGKLSEDFSIDDYREGWKQTDATQDVYFTAAEKRRLMLVVTAVNVGWTGSMKYC